MGFLNIFRDWTTTIFQSPIVSIDMGNLYITEQVSVDVVILQHINIPLIITKQIELELIL